MDTREGRHSQSIVMPLLPSIRALNEGDRRHPVGVAHITLTAIPSLYREAPDGVLVPLTTVAALSAVAPPPVTVGHFLTVHPQTTAPIHTTNQTSLLPKATLDPHH